MVLKAHELRGKSRHELEQQLQALKTELYHWQQRLSFDRRLLLEVGGNEGHCEKSASSRFFFRTLRPSAAEQTTEPSA